MSDSSLKIPQISAEDVKKAIDANEDIIILDVRTSEEYSKGHLARSINISLDAVQDTVDKMITDKNKIVYVYCLSGSRSALAVETMIKLGYTKVFNMTSGMLAWRARKYPQIV